MISKFRRNKLVPTAPAAAASPRVVTDTPVSRSRVRVVRGNGMALGYVSPPTTAGHATVVASADKALVLDIPKAQNAQQSTHIRIMARNGINTVQYPFVGLENYGGGEHWRLRACEEGLEGSVFKERARADSTTVAHVASSKVWSIKKLEGSIEELCMHWLEDTGVRSCLQAIIPSASNLPIGLWMRKAPVGSEESVVCY
ncbi:hypothetical protein FRB95_010992 [Tulasnella sp. JGI-2019a]|nr:hypothetical protein FRB95_010992 [Tulasnella sp. JGI-2019a]